VEPASCSSIVVGHHGSDGADFALTAALDHADQLRAPVVIVRAWFIATAPRPPGREFGYVASRLAALRRDELRRMNAAALMPATWIDTP
jgi:hypothetical protein